MEVSIEEKRGKEILRVQEGHYRTQLWLIKNCPFPLIGNMDKNSCIFWYDTQEIISADS